MTTVNITLLADFVTLAVTVAAAIKKPILSYRIMAGIAVVPTAFAGNQVLTRRVGALAVLSISLLVFVMMWRIALNLRVPRRGWRR
jgi:hypothetical protein